MLAALVSLTMNTGDFDSLSASDVVVCDIRSVLVALIRPRVQYTRVTW